jgi:UDP-glucose 4-epimerase
MRALVTGGAGFIGSAVVRHGLSLGWSLTVLDDFSTGDAENLPDSPEVVVVEGDVRDAVAVKAALRDVSLVFHLAAAVGNVRSLEDPFADCERNVMGTVTLLESMRESGISRLVYSSSAAAYGEPVALPVLETHPVAPASPYGVSKLAAEKYALCYASVYGWRAACLRYFNVYGRNQVFDAYGNVIPIFATALLAGDPIVVYGDGLQTRDFVSVEDVAQANWLAAAKDANGVFNIGSGQATTVNELARLLREICASDTSVEYRAPRLGEVRDSVAGIESAEATFGYKPTVGLADGLRDYVAWLQSR